MAALGASGVWAQTGSLKQSAPAASEFTVASGTRIPLGLINSPSTKSAAVGDSVYMQTVFPILANGRIVIPPGSYVSGTITYVKRPGRVRGRGEMYVRFDSLTLPNGVTRDFRARITGLDGRANEELDKSEGKIKSEGDKGGDARVIAESAGAGAGLGTVAGAAAGHVGQGLGIGAAAGAVGGLIGVLVSRGPDAVLAQGSTIEMVLDRPLSFTASELDFSHPMPQASNTGGAGPLPSRKRSRGFPTRGWPY